MNVFEGICMYKVRSWILGFIKTDFRPIYSFWDRKLDKGGNLWGVGIYPSNKSIENYGIYRILLETIGV